MRKYIVGFLVGAVFTISTTGFADTVITKVDAYFNSSIPIIVDGKQLTLDKPVAIIDGSSYVPLKLIGDALGKSVKWNDTTKSIELTSVIDPSKSAIANVGVNQVYYSFKDIYPTFGLIEGSKYIGGKQKASLTYKGTDYIVNQDSDYYYDMNTDYIYFSESFLKTFLSIDELKKFNKYSIDYKNKVVEIIK